MDHSFFYELSHRLYLADYPEQFYLPFIIQTGDGSHYLASPIADSFDGDYLFIGCSFSQLREKLDLSTAQNVFSPFSIYEYVIKLEYLDRYDLEAMVTRGNKEAASTLAHYKKKKYQDPELPYAFVVYEEDGLTNDEKHYPLDQEHYMALLDCLNILQKMKAMGKKKLVELLEDDSYEGMPILAMDGDKVSKLPYPISASGVFERSLDLFRGMYSLMEGILADESEEYDDDDEYDEYDAYEDDEVYDLEDEDEDEDDLESLDSFYEELTDFLHSSNKIVDFHSHKKK